MKSGAETVAIGHLTVGLESGAVTIADANGPRVEIDAVALLDALSRLGVATGRL